MCREYHSRDTNQYVFRKLKSKRYVFIYIRYEIVLDNEMCPTLCVHFLISFFSHKSCTLEVYAIYINKCYMVNLPDL